MKPVKVVHCVGTYLPNTENWLYRLIKNQHNTRKFVASNNFIDCPFYSSDVNYLRSPYDFHRNCVSAKNIFSRILNKIRKRFRPSYPSYVADQLGSEGIDIVHSHFAHVGWKYQDLATKLNAMHVVSFYGMDYEFIPHTLPFWRPRYQSLFQTADIFICEGTHGAATLLKLGCSEHKIAVARLGVNVAEIPFHKRSKNAGELKLVQIASFREKKGHVYTIRAFAKALQLHPDISLTLIGDGDPAQVHNIMNEIESLGVSRNVTVFPGIDFSCLHELLGQYHVFIHPSCHTADKDCEGGAPVVLLDAQATGMPVISTLHCDIPEEVIDRHSGLLCTEADVDQLAEAISTFYKMPQEVYSTFADNARRHVSEKYDIVSNANQLVELYRIFSSATLADRQSSLT